MQNILLFEGERREYELKKALGKENYEKLEEFLKDSVLMNNVGFFCMMSTKREWNF